MLAEHHRDRVEEVNLGPDKVVLLKSLDEKTFARGVEGKFMGRINHGPRKSTFAVALKSHVLLKGLLCPPTGTFTW